MFHVSRKEIGQAALITLTIGCMAFQSQAAWDGAGVAGGGTGGTDINDTNNWAGGVVSGDFSTIVSNATLLLTSDYTATNGINFIEPYFTLRHITVSETNTLTAKGNVPGFASGSRTLMLPTNANSTVTLSRGLKLNLPATCNTSGYGTLFIDALVSGAGSYNHNYIHPYGYQPLSILRNDANTFTGGIGGDCGRLHFTSIANKGVPSALGAGTYLNPNNFSLLYIGSRTWGSNRDYNPMHAGVGLFINSGSGGLSLTGTVSIGSGAHTCLTLGSISSGESLLTGNINNSPPSYTRIAKVHSGVWRLAGKNTFTGWTNNANHVSLTGGSLIADYMNDISGAGSNRLFAAGRTVYYADGKLVVRGKTGAGNTTWQELGTNIIENNSFNALSVEGNGGDGTTVSLEALYAPYEYSSFRMERSGIAAICSTNAISADAGTVRLINGVLMGNNGLRANILAQDPDGRVGFATQNGTLECVRHTDTLALTADNSSATDHISLASDLTRTASLSFSTLAIDASANSVTLDMGGNLFQTNSTGIGRGIVINGSYPVDVRGGTHSAQPSTFIFNYGTDKLAWELTNSTRIYVSAGPGLTEFTQALANSLFVAEGTTRLTAAKNFAEGVIYVFANGVLEIGADLNGATGGEFSRWVGSASGQIYFAAGGGFSAYGANRTVNLGGAANPVYWSSGGFVQDGKPFILSSPHANATLIFQNPIAMQNRTREIRVLDGSAGIDARLTGRITGGQYTALIKSGAGTLELTGNQDYRGDVSVIGGGLLLGADDVFAGATNALVLSGATFNAGTVRNAFDTLELLSDSAFDVGNGSATLSFSDCSDKTWTGTLTISGKLNPTTLRFGTDSTGLSPAQLASISNRGYSVYLDAQGYLQQNPPGTCILIQ
jgi:autotransporter-associated beta strand protein